MSYFQNASEFKTYFDLDNDYDYDYENYTEFEDIKVGFSIQKNYPSEKFRYIPPKNKKGEVDTVALIHVIYRNQESIINENVNQVPIIFRVSKFSRYRNKHFDYDFEDETCPTRESIELSEKSPQPVDIENETYKFDHNLQSFIDDSNNKVKGRKIIDDLYQKHIDTVHLIKGLKVRSKIVTKSKFMSVLKRIINLLTWILNIGFGRTLDEKSNKNLFLLGYKKEDLKKLKTDSFEIFNYKVSRGILLIFCLTIISLNLLYFWFEFSCEYIKTIKSNQFLILVHSLLYLYLLDVIIPIFIFFILNKIIKYRTHLMFKKVKV